MSIGIGIGFSGWPFGDTNPEAFWSAVDLAESLAIDSLWLSDRVVSEALSLEPVVALSWVAARTRKMKFGTSVLALPLRNPTVLAKELATLDFLSGGRLLLAVGLGRDDDTELQACGIHRSERAGRTEEMVHLLRALWSGNGVSSQGKYYQLQDVSIAPKPAQAAPPIWVGGRSGPAFRRTARLADGWMGSQMTPAEVATAITRIRKYADDYGRRIDDDHFGVLFNFCFAEDARKPPPGPPLRPPKPHRRGLRRNLRPGNSRGHRRRYPTLHRRRRLQVRRPPRLPARGHPRTAQAPRHGGHSAVYVTRARSLRMSFNGSSCLVETRTGIRYTPL